MSYNFWDIYSNTEQDQKITRYGELYESNMERSVWQVSWSSGVWKKSDDGNESLITIFLTHGGVRIA